MHFTILTAANQYTGLGHYTRMTALADELLRQEHTVTFVSDLRYKTGSELTWRYPYINPILKRIKTDGTDWLIVDLPGETPSNVYKKKHWKTCTFDGIGHPPSNGNINISQGMSGEYHAPEYLILRSDILDGLSIDRHRDHIFVFGGANDLLNLEPYWKKL